MRKEYEKKKEKKRKPYHNQMKYFYQVNPCYYGIRKVPWFNFPGIGKLTPPGLTPFGSETNLGTPEKNLNPASLSPQVFSGKKEAIARRKKNKKGDEFDQLEITPVVMK